MKRMKKEIGTIPTSIPVLWKVGMKRILIALLIYLAAHLQVYAGLVTDDPKTEDALKANVVDFRDWLMKELSQFPKSSLGHSAIGSSNYAVIPRKKCFTASQYNQAAKSDWVKAQVMQGLSTLSQQLANTVGTAFAQQSAGQLQQSATQLQQSDDPQFQQIGALYTQEAQALQTGNVQGADQAANQVAAVPQPYVAPGYQPSQNELAQAQGFTQIIGTIIASLGGILGTTAVTQILQALGIPNLGSLLGGSGQGIGSSNGAGQMTGPAVANSGTNSNQAGGSVGLQQLGAVTVKSLQNQGSANAGAAPPAQ